MINLMIYDFQPKRVGISKGITCNIGVSRKATTIYPPRVALEVAADAGIIFTIVVVIRSSFDIPLLV